MTRKATESIFHQQWHAAQRDEAGDTPQDARDGSVEINGVWLPLALYYELIRLGYDLTRYSVGELIDAQQAFFYDRRLIEDMDGSGFRDKLSYNAIERMEDNGEIPCEAYRANPFHVHPITYSQQLKEDRAHSFYCPFTKAEHENSRSCPA